MNNKRYSILSVSLFLLGIFMYAWYHEYIIINPRKSFFVTPQENNTQKQKITLHHFKQTWHKDQVQILLSENYAQNAQLIIGCWLENALEEGLLKKKTLLQQALLTQNQELILSFDRTLFNKESSTFDKWMIIEGILKSLKESTSSIKKVRFLVNHQPLIDPHLDFSNSWPIEGFLN